MTDYVTFETGALPWKPSAGAEEGLVLHRFTIPLVGTFTQDGNHFLYWCVVGHAGPEQAWGYARVSKEEAETLNGIGHFDQALPELVSERTIAFAMSSDEEGIRVGVDIDPPASFYDIYEHGMRCIHRRIEKATEEYAALAAAFPLMRPPGVAPSVGSHRSVERQPTSLAG